MCQTGEQQEKEEEYRFLGQGLDYLISFESARDLMK